METSTIGPLEQPNKYSIGKLLGEGLTGNKVYLGFDEQNKTVAVKLLKSKSSYTKEVQCLKYVQSICGEYILCYIDDFETIYNNKTYYVIVTDFISGYISLEQYLEDNKPSSNNLKLIYKNINSALDLLHTIRVEHADLHSENILVDPSTLNVKLIDLGGCAIHEYEAEEEEEFEPQEDPVALKKLFKLLGLTE